MSVNERGYPHAATEDVMMIQETMQVLGLYDGVVDGLHLHAGLVVGIWKAEGGVAVHGDPPSGGG